MDRVECALPAKFIRGIEQLEEYRKNIILGRAVDRNSRKLDDCDIVSVIEAIFQPC